MVIWNGQRTHIFLRSLMLRDKSHRKSRQPFEAFTFSGSFMSHWPVQLSVIRHGMHVNHLSFRPGSGSGLHYTSVTLMRYAWSVKDIIIVKEIHVDIKGNLENVCKESVLLKQIMASLWTTHHICPTRHRNYHHCDGCRSHYSHRHTEEMQIRPNNVKSCTVR